MELRALWITAEPLCATKKVRFLQVSLCYSRCRSRRNCIARSYVHPYRFSRSFAGASYPARFAAAISFCARFSCVLRMFFFSRSSFSLLALTVHTILRGKLPINWLYLVFETAYTVSLFLSLPRLPSSSLCFFRVLPGTQAATFR